MPEQLTRPDERPQVSQSTWDKIAESKDFKDPMAAHAAGQSSRFSSVEVHL